MPTKFFNGGIHSFSFLPSGHIRCEECGTDLWCVHIKQAMVKRWDATAIWDKPDNSEYAPQLNLQIPMFPTENLWTEVKLFFPQSSPVPRYRVAWCGLNSDWVTICFINPGEGRNIIRSSLVDYMMGDIHKQTECSAPHHGFQAQRRWEIETTKGNSKLWAQLWSVYSTGYCLTCKDINPSDPDLVPPEQRTGVWNTGGTV